jgi:hypothetical protein
VLHGRGFPKGAASCLAVAETPRARPILSEIARSFEAPDSPPGASAYMIHPGSRAFSLAIAQAWLRKSENSMGVRLSSVLGMFFATS